VIISFFPQNFERAISMLVPAVFVVLKKINLYLWEIITTIFENNTNGNKSKKYQLLYFY
jgi:hypothetical protein